MRTIHRPLQARPGPRIRALAVDSAPPRPADPAPRPAFLTPRALITGNPLHSRHHSLDVVAHLGLAALSFGLATFGPGIPWWGRLVLLGLMAFGLQRARSADQRELNREIERLRCALEIQTPADELRERCQRVLVLDPDQHSARLLLASLLLEEGDALSCLMQLAPLRDADPGQGEVVVMAALAWLQLGRREEARVLLEALEPSEDPGLQAWIAELRAELGDPCLQDGS